MGEFVRLEVSGGVGTIRLDRPPVNAMNDQLTAELADAAGTVASSPEIRAVIVYGGEKAFAAGADIGDMAERPPTPAADRPATSVTHAR